MKDQQAKGPGERPGPPRSGTYWSAMLFGLSFPTVLTFAYFVLLAPFPASVQQITYGLGKAVQFGFPVLFLVWIARTRPHWTWPGWRGVVVGLVFGAAIFAAMLVLYFTWLRNSDLLLGLQDQVLSKVQDLGLDTPWKYAATGLFYALAHSLLEEYYWRWFVFGQLNMRMGLPGAVLLSSLGFMAHHVILLATYFGWNSPWAYLFATGVAVGGAFWAWLYARSRSLLGPWLSHMLIDAAIFLIGYDLVRATMS